MLTSATGEETLTPNSNECNSTLTSGTRGIYPHRYILMRRVTAYVFSTRGGEAFVHLESKLNTVLKCKALYATSFFAISMPL